MPDPQKLPRFLQGEADFRWRGGDVSRVEALTDVVFALSLTLLVVALEVPRDFTELMRAFRHLPSFAVCFALLLMVWYYNYQFHRRFGLEDFPTLVLNGLLLFLILFYVYPLKFLFTLLIDDWFYGIAPTGRIGGGDVPALMLLYSGGFSGIFLVFLALNLRAYRHRDALALDDVEVSITRRTLYSHLIYVGVGLLSAALALLHTGWAGMVYFLIGPLQGLNGYLGGREQAKLKKG